MNTQDRVRLLYQHILGREADAEGLKHWTAQAERDGNITRVAEALLSSEEYAERVRSTFIRRIPAAVLNARLKALGRDLLIVDVGAQRLGYEEHVYVDLLSTGAYKIIGFEPLDQRRTERLNSENDPRLTLLPQFVGDGSEQTFYVNNFDATSSLYPLNDSIIQLFSELHVLKTEKSFPIKTEPLDFLLADVGPIDFLKLDIQGFELQALRGASQVLARTNVVHCEVEFCQIYAGQPLFSEVELFLRERGFDLIDLVKHAHGSYRLKSGNSRQERLLYAEAVFFKRSDPDLVAQAIIAWMVYGKIGLAERLIGLYDEKNRTARTISE